MINILSNSKVAFDIYFETHAYLAHCNCVHFSGLYQAFIDPAGIRALELETKLCRVSTVGCVECMTLSDWCAAAAALSLSKLSLSMENTVPLHFLTARQ